MRNFMIHTLWSIPQIALHTQTQKIYLTYTVGRVPWIFIYLWVTLFPPYTYSWNPSEAYKIYIIRCLDPNSFLMLKIVMLNIFSVGFFFFFTFSFFTVDFPKHSGNWGTEDGIVNNGIKPKKIHLKFQMFVTFPSARACNKT